MSSERWASSKNDCSSLTARLSLLCRRLPPKLNQHFRVSVNSLVEAIVGVRGVFDADAMAHDFAGLGFAGDDQVTQILVIFFHGRLTAAHGDSLVEIVSQGKWENPL